MLRPVADPDFVLDADARERLIDRFGPGTDQWCDALPDLVSRCCLRWDLELDEARSGGTARVFIGRQHGTRGVVLKLTPDLSIAGQEAVALRAWAATPHAADLLDADPETGALLLERVEPGIRLADQPELPPFTAIAELLAALRVTDGDLAGRLPALVQRTEFLFTLIARRRRRPQVSALVTPDMVTRGRRLSRKLATSGGAAGLVHGDLGPPNVLLGGPARGLVAIDPRPCFGDYTSDAIDWALGRSTTAGELRDRIERLCALLPGLDGDRLLEWCQGTAVIIAVQYLYRRPPDQTTPLLLELAASA